MKSKAKSVEECSTLFEIDVSAQTISKAFEDVYNEITKAANIPGFRVGKAPRELVRRHYSKDARDEVLKRLIPEAYRGALDEHRISPIGLPEITDVVFEGEETLSFKAKVDTRPKFKLKNYKGLELKKKKVEVTGEEVTRTMENLREVNAKYITVEDRPLRMGDYAVTDLDCHVDGKPVHKKRENLWLYLDPSTSLRVNPEHSRGIDKESIVPALSENMTGMKKEEEKDIEVVLPDSYPDKSLAAKKARYHVVVKEIKSRILPNLDDEFAKDLGRKDLEDLKREVCEELEARSKVDAEIDMENQFLARLMDDNPFPVPSGLVNRQLGHMVADAKRRLSRKGFRQEDLDKRDAELKEKFKNDAVRQTRLLFILDEISRVENIGLEEDDLKDAYKSIAAQTAKSEEAVRDHYEKEDLVDGLKDRIRQEKTIQFLLKESKIVEA